MSLICRADSRISKRYGEYKVVIERNAEKTEGIFTVYKRNKQIYQERDWGSYYWFGNHFDESLKNSDIYSGKDLTGRKVPNLIISKWTGGAHCCNYLSIYEMGKNKFKKLTTVDGGSYGFRIFDLNKDMIPEIEFWDWPIDYLFSSFAGSAQGKTILEYTEGEYRVASKIMLKPVPDQAVIEKKKSEIRLAFKNMNSAELPYTFLELMMDLSYSGHVKLAIKVAEDVWPKTKPGLAEFKLEFSRALSGSPYWREFYLYLK